MARIRMNVEKILDRGPKFGWVEVQVNFEKQASSDEEMALASVIISLPKADVGKLSLDEIRARALAKALSFTQECANSAAAG